MSVQVLDAAGILRPQDTIDAARAAGLELAAACAVLAKESSGGRNVWGHDDVQSGGTYTPGAEVTRDAYLAYRKAQDAGRIGAQGVGPCQLTYPPLQRTADADGGCWDPRANMRGGFRELARLLRSKGERDGACTYNGGRSYSDPKASAASKRYADDFLDRLAFFRQRLSGAAASTSSPTPATSTAGRPSLHEGDTGPLVAALQRWMNATFPAYASIDTGPQRIGPQTVAAVTEFQRRSGIPTGGRFEVGPRTWAAMESNGFRG